MLGRQVASVSLQPQTCHTFLVTYHTCHTIICWLIFKVVVKVVASAVPPEPNCAHTLLSTRSTQLALRNQRKAAILPDLSIPPTRLFSQRRHPGDVEQAGHPANELTPPKLARSYPETAKRGLKHKKVYSADNLFAEWPRNFPIRATPGGASVVGSPCLFCSCTLVADFGSSRAAASCVYALGFFNFSSAYLSLLMIWSFSWAELSWVFR